MRGTAQLPTLSALKDQARRLRSRMEANGDAINHSRALELIAAQFGFNDWNTRSRPSRWCNFPDGLRS
ncbi:hypothetical protein HPDFL43_00037560 [Hoeflea phototrophica DFL-43]|uniref:Glyoxalase-related protein domain-containing protein n=1 Tax=Hoeflea phototrophica (strain DSM 17068 / NCIMB 14078 / DFL-43) TaxID=411684 RepID=A0A095BE03_HOEPD|nr:hypothetical protein HPDFL43_00037560 [Hoeflea phototrophica DFL-43]